MANIGFWLYSRFMGVGRMRLAAQSNPSLRRAELEEFGREQGFRNAWEAVINEGPTESVALKQMTLKAKRLIVLVMGGKRE